MTISLITTTYNSAETLRDTFEAVLAQSYTDIDYWVIDGGSKDNTVEIIKEYEPKFNGRMHWLSERDRGLYDGMNKGIERATGDVVGIINSDDFFTSRDVLETVAKTFMEDTAHELDAVYGDIHFVNASNLDKCVRYYSSKNFRPWLMRFGYMPAHPSFYARTEIYRKHGLYSLDYKLAADYDMMVRLLCKERINARYIAKDFVTMRTGGASTSSIKHRLLLTREDAKACRRYGIYSNFLLCSVKYFTKMFEFI